ncbi:MAG: heme-binding domain-containing protein [Acidimicrobiia bacterium]|nr:heme-binding domain-containing protein [Acidimicrobiia bacterium]
MKRTKLRGLLKIGLAGAAALLLIIQLLPVDRVNPPVVSELVAPPEVISVLRQSCYDCHSNETTWPWYSRIAPASWLVAKDVREGREAVNYSTWGRYDAEERAEKQWETWEDVEEGEMPMRIYTLMHPGARLTAQDRDILRDWAAQSGHAADGETDHERAEESSRH